MSTWFLRWAQMYGTCWVTHTHTKWYVHLKMDLFTSFTKANHFHPNLHIPSSYTTNTNHLLLMLDSTCVTIMTMWREKGFWGTWATWQQIETPTWHNMVLSPALKITRLLNTNTIQIKISLLIPLWKLPMICHVTVDPFATKCSAESNKKYSFLLGKQ